MEVLDEYAWPGNVRELQNLMERLAVVQPAHLPSELRGVLGSGVGKSAELSTLAELERQHVEEALIRCQWNQSHAAKLLGISRDQLRHRILRYGIKGSWRVGAPVHK